MEIVLPVAVYALGDNFDMRKLRIALNEYNYPHWVFKLSNYETLPEPEKSKFLQELDKVLNGDTNVSDTDALVVASILTKKKYLSKLPTISEGLFEMIKSPIINPPINTKLLQASIEAAVKNNEPLIFPQAIVDVFGLQNRIPNYDKLIEINRKHPQFEEKYEYFKNLAENYKKDPWSFVNRALEKYNLEELMYAYTLLALSITADEDDNEGYILLTYAIITAMSTMDDLDIGKELENPKGTVNDVGMAFSFMDSTKDDILGAFSMLLAANSIISLL